MKRNIILWVVILIAVGLFFQLRKVLSAKQLDDQAEVEQPFNLSPQNVSVEGILFQNIPASLASTMQKAEAGEIPDYGTLTRLHALASSEDSNPETLIALSWLQAHVVESGVYIDDLENDFKKANAFYEDYGKKVGDQYSDAFLPVAEKLDRLQAKLQWLRDNPL